MKLLDGGIDGPYNEPDPYSEIERLRTELVRTRTALKNIVENVNDYERVNNLAPSPGRTECWDSVAIAKAILADPQI